MDSYEPFSRRQQPTSDDGSVDLVGVPEATPLFVRVMMEHLSEPLPDYYRRHVAFGDGHHVVRLADPVSISGTVKAADGSLGKEHWVVADWADTRQSVHAEIVKTLPSGAFAFKRLRPGNYRVYVTENWDYAITAPVAIHAPARDLEIVLSPTATVLGRLLVDNPLDWRVSWCTEPKDLSAHMGREGHFKFHSVRDEPATLFATRHKDNRVVFLEHVRPKDGPFELKPVVGLPLAGALTGDAPATGRLHIQLRRGAVTMLRRVDANGRFAFNNVPEGTWDVEVWHRAKQVGTSTRVTAGTTDVLVEMPR